MASSTAQQAPTPAPQGLKEGIAGLYDESSGLWESIWGDHMHHGFYDSGEAASMDDHRRAQIRMIEEALAFAAVPGASSVQRSSPRPRILALRLCPPGYLKSIG
jgi:tocopherol O-methyltransferase